MKDAIETDILVIGGGMAGIGFAAALGEGRKVLVLEQERDLAYHSTGRSAAIYIRNYGNGPIRALNEASGPMFKAESEYFPHPLLTPRGILDIADSARAHEIGKLAAISVGVEEISADAAIAKVPLLSPDYVKAAAFEADAQDIDVHALHQGWLKKAKGQGASVLTGQEVLRAEHANGCWKVETKDHQITAKLIVNAAGAWADEIARRCNVAPVGLQPLRRSMAVLPVPDGYDAAHWPLVDEVTEDFYFKPDGGRLFVSPCDEDPVDPHDAFADDMVLAEGLHRFEQAVNMEVTRVERSWAGLRTFAPDRSPVVGFDGGTEGFFWLAGQGGYGIQTAPALSKFAAELAENRTPELHHLVEPLSPTRFNEGK